MRHFDRIDLLVNSAGIYITKPFTEYTPDDFAQMIATNVAGYFFVTQQVVTHMRKQKSGHVVSISTVLTDQPLAGVAYRNHAPVHAARHRARVGSRSRCPDCVSGRYGPPWHGDSG